MVSFFWYWFIIVCACYPGKSQHARIHQGMQKRRQTECRIQSRTDKKIRLGPQVDWKIENSSFGNESSVHESDNREEESVVESGGTCFHSQSHTAKDIYYTECIKLMKASLIKEQGNE